LGSLLNLSGDNTFGGPIHLGADTLLNSFSNGDTLTLTGNIDNNFALTVAGPGNTTLGGDIRGTAGIVTGWREDRLSGYQNWAGTPSSTPLFVSVPRWGSMYDGFVTNTTYVYTGEVFDEDGFFSLAFGPHDDNARIAIDGVQRALGGGPATTGTAGTPYNGGAPGWVPVDVRFSNSGGPGGSYGTNNNWKEYFGFGLNATGTTSVNANDYVPADVLLQPDRFRNAWASAVNSITKLDGGTLTLSGANTYDGSTTVRGGTLLVNGDSSAASGALTVHNGAVLGGTGAIGGAVTMNDVTSGTTLSPGDPMSGPASWGPAI
jgi:fibronectin-binding autotransporter adhesin